MKIIKHIIIVLLIPLSSVFGQSVEGNVDNLPIHEYTLTIKEEIVNKAGKQIKGMTVNGTIPGPTLEFTEGEYAVIYVKNEMSEETSVHWHGLLLPNFYDGVPYLTTPPVEPGHTLKYEFPIKHSGTYWYHSHTMLQEQSGVYGSIVIKPKTKILNYDKDLVLVLSDWTNEKPMNVLRNLKRGNEWYNIKKGTATPLNQVIARGGFSAQLNFWRQRMESADIADVYYPAFLINGKQSIEYPEFKPGEKVRLRIIDGAASTSFWMTFGGEMPLLVAADGNDVIPVKKNKTFIGVAETYDFIITIPDDGKIEYKITAQDGSGSASAFMGNGKIIPAMSIPRPDKIGMMKKMSKMDMKMGAHALKFQPNKDERFEMKDEYGMHMEEMSGKENKKEMKMDHSKMDMNKPIDSMSMKMDHSKMIGMNIKKERNMQGMDMYAEYNYDYLKSPNKTNYDKNVPVKEVLLNLTGNMNRYIWSLNGVPLSEADKIKISSKEVTRITFNNLTMMHHPMHLHGHFFRVINENGDYSPLKHTVNVPPMQKVTIEFYGNNGDEYGDWFFHCHILYHMMGGMARIVSYDTPRNTKMKEYPKQKLINETNKWYSWGMINSASHTTGFNLMTSNLRNQFNASLEYGWNKNLETEFTYERYLHDYLRVFGGVNIENKNKKSLDQFKTTAVAGIRFLTPYLFSLDARIDNELKPRIALGRSIMIFPKLSVFGYYEYQLDLGIVNDLPTTKNYISETVWRAGASYLLSRNFSLFSSYDSRFEAGAGLMARF